MDLIDDPKLFDHVRTLSSDELREAVCDFLEKKWEPVYSGKIRFEIDAQGEVIAKIFLPKLHVARHV